MEKLKRSTAKPDYIIGMLFSIRDKAHLMHLKTTSYAQHIALQEFYDGLMPFIDQLAEGYLGQESFEINIPESSVSGINSLDYIEEVYNVVANFREQCSHLWAIPIYDDILVLTAGTMYKIKNLK